MLQKDFRKNARVRVIGDNMLSGREGTVLEVDTGEIKVFLDCTKADLIKEHGLKDARSITREMKLDESNGFQPDELKIV